MSIHRTNRAPGHGRATAAAAPSLGLLLAAGTLLTACETEAFADTGPITTEHRPVDGAHAVDLRTSGDLTITTGAPPQLTIPAARTRRGYLTALDQDGTVVRNSRS